MLFPELPAPLYVLFLQALHFSLKCLAAFLFFQALRHLFILCNTPPELPIRYRELISLSAIPADKIGVFDLPIPDRFPFRIRDNRATFLTDNLHLIPL